MINESLLGNPIESSKVESDTSNTRSLRGGGHRNHLHFRKVTWIPQKKSWFGKGDSFQNMATFDISTVWYSMWNFLWCKKFTHQKRVLFFRGGANLPNLPTNSRLQRSEFTSRASLNSLVTCRSLDGYDGWIWWMDMMQPKKSSQSLQIWKKNLLKPEKCRLFVRIFVTFC